MDIQGYLQDVLKYLIEGVGVAIAAHLISGQRYSMQEIALIGLSAAFTLMILDNYSPRTSFGTRQGMGFGIGLKLSGNLPTGVEGFQAPGQIDIVRSNVVPDGSSHYNQNCSCQQPCKDSCQAVEGQCDLECPEAAPCHIQGTDSIGASNCSFKMIDGYYSKALLPGYNECVKPYNS